ncbi:hypothetical protein [Aliterella atlantica]
MGELPLLKVVIRFGCAQPQGELRLEHARDGLENKDAQTIK